jgi:hypothetical protein
MELFPETPGLSGLDLSGRDRSEPVTRRISWTENSSRPSLTTVYAKAPLSVVTFTESFPSGDWRVVILLLEGAARADMAVKAAVNTLQIKRNMVPIC